MHQSKSMSDPKEDATDAFGFRKKPNSSASSVRGSKNVTAFKACRNNFRNKEETKTDEEWNNPPRSQIDKDADFYVMDPEKKNIAVIFNHHSYDDYQITRRDGTIKDARDLTATLEDLNFDVKTYTDLKYGAIYDVIRQLAQVDHSNTNCLVIAVMTHGDSGKLYARDHQYATDTLWMPFTGDKCPLLAGKPKLFFIQACRGEDVDGGVAISSRAVVQTDSPSEYTIPSMADFLVMYSTYDGFFSWRSPVSGSWFVQSLCKELKQRARHFDLQTILTFVNRRMGIQYTSNVPNNPYMHEKKQIGTVVSTLTRMLYLYPPSDI